MMKSGVSQCTSAAGAAVASEVPSCYMRGWSPRRILLVIGSLLGAWIDTSWRGFLSVTAVHLTGSAGKDNPSLIAASQRSVDLPQNVVDFLARQNIPKVHGAGVKVDLSHEKSVDGKLYREVGGKCPVYGKYIELYQPQRAPYENNFLSDVPTEAEHQKQGNPLPGGFGMTMATANKERFSPMPLSRLQGAPSIITATTDLGKCAQYAYQTHALSPSTNKKTDYRFPFVYDPEKKLCYLLYISMQQMLGKKYCSMYGDSDVTWYCFEPMKNPNKNAHLVYGSAYVGEDPEYFVKNCPDKALAGQKFGVLVGGVCRDYTATEDAIVTEVDNKEACWVLAFTNDKVASDQPAGYETWAANPWVNWLPYLDSQWPQSQGKGYNYAVFYIDRHQKKRCVLSNHEPACLITDASAVSYTALSGLEEVTLEYESPSKEHYTSCDYNRCTRVWTREEFGQVVAEEEVSCSEEDQKNCKGNGFLIGGLTVLGIIVAGALAGGFIYLKKKKAVPAPEGAAQERDVAFDPDEQKRRRTRQGDLMQEAEPSFWDEADEDTGNADQTNVMVEEAG